MARRTAEIKERRALFAANANANQGEVHDTSNDTWTKHRMALTGTEKTPYCAVKVPYGRRRGTV
jgi:hypothetical protein